MTVITISTIGYGEIVNLAGNAAGRIFTIFIALSGIGTLAYLLSNVTAFIVEGELKETFWRRKMEKRVSTFKNHYIVCGAEGVGFYIIEELYATKRLQVIVDVDKEKVERLLETFPDLAFIVGDATDDKIIYFLRRTSKMRVDYLPSREMITIIWSSASRQSSVTLW